MHPIRAIRAFFLVMFGRPLPLEIAAGGLEPDAGAPGPASLPAPAPAEAEDTAPTKVPQKAEDPKAPAGPSPEAAAVQTLAVLQAEGRLLDFLSEDIEGFSDEEVGAAVREVHRGLKKALADHFDLVPVREEEEDALVSVEEGYDPAAVRLVGNVVGQPPFSGTLRHKGWRATDVRLPRLPDGEGATIVAPAEVEV